MVEGNKLKDYVDSLSRVMSYRDSDRFFTRSRRRNNVVAGIKDVDVEVNTNGFGVRD